MMKLVLLRHGQSEWNLENRFTGWTDVDLSEQGIREAVRAGQLMKEAGLQFDAAYTSVLQRAIKTLGYALNELGQLWIPVQKTWRLNERHYGALQGLNKAETAAKYGESQVLLWRRGFDIKPPLLESDDERNPASDRRYAGMDQADIPLGESLATTIDRFIPYWEETIVPALKAGRQAIIAAHGNSLRGLVKHLDNISDEDIIDLNIPTGIPLVYELDDSLKPVNKYYLGNTGEIAKSIHKVADQGKINI